jgi:hypothetical protein
VVTLETARAVLLDLRDEFLDVIAGYVVVAILDLVAVKVWIALSVMKSLVPGFHHENDFASHSTLNVTDDVVEDRTTIGRKYVIWEPLLELFFEGTYYMVLMVSFDEGPHYFEQERSVLENEGAIIVVTEGFLQDGDSGFQSFPECSFLVRHQYLSTYTTLPGEDMIPPQGACFELFAYGVT